MNSVTIIKCNECGNWIPADSDGCGCYCDELQKVVLKSDEDLLIPDCCPKLVCNICDDHTKTIDEEQYAKMFWQYWGKRWPSSTCNKKTLQLSANFRETTAAFFAGMHAALKVMDD